MIRVTTSAAHATPSFGHPWWTGWNPRACVWPGCTCSHLAACRGRPGWPDATLTRWASSSPLKGMITGTGGSLSHSLATKLCVKHSRNDSTTLTRESFSILVCTGKQTYLWQLYPDVVFTLENLETNHLNIHLETCEQRAGIFLWRWCLCAIGLYLWISSYFHSTLRMRGIWHIWLASGIQVCVAGAWRQPDEVLMVSRAVYMATAIITSYLRVIPTIFGK